jgi:hypothetical protein
MNVVNAYFGALSDTAKIIGTSVSSEKTLLDNKVARDDAEIAAINKRRELQKAVKQEGGKAGEDYAVVASNGLNWRAASRADRAGNGPKAVALVRRTGERLLVSLVSPHMIGLCCLMGEEVRRCRHG